MRSSVAETTVKQGPPFVPSTRRYQPLTEIHPESIQTRQRSQAFNLDGQPRRRLDSEDGAARAEGGQEILVCHLQYLASLEAMVRVHLKLDVVRGGEAADPAV